MSKIFIEGTGQHADDVAASFVLGYESNGRIFDGEFVKQNANFQIAFDSGSVVYVKSTEGLINTLPSFDSATYYLYLAYILGGMMTFMPAGANTPGEIYNSHERGYPDQFPYWLVPTGAGDTENETADDVEFIANDPITTETTPDEQDLSSYSNPFIAGQLCTIKDVLACSWYQARLRARLTGSENGVWHETRGYGFINVPAAIAYIIPRKERMLKSFVI